MEQTLTRPLTRAQQARRQRVIDAAMALGLEGGYEAVQMRDVAARADVAMGTVYRYFTSKDHLLAATLVHWVEMLDTRIGQHPPRGDHPADRVLDVLDRALRAMGRQPKLVAAVFTSLSSPDPAAVGCQQQITLLMEGIISRAMGERDVPDMADRARMIGHVWYSALVGWVNGWSTMARVYDELAVSVRLLLPDELVERRTPRPAACTVTPAARRDRSRASALALGSPRMTAGATPRGLPIEINGLSKHFGPVLAVDDLSFTVEPGRVTGFLGPNGSGKTTTLRMLLGLVHPSAGTATIGGRSYQDLANPTSTVGAVLEATSFHPARRARTHLRMAARAGGHDEKRADEVLELVGLTGDAKRKVGGFSMGMRQRLELATALIGDPDVLILDEPSNGLDPQGIAWLRDFMRYLAGEGRTVLVSSHLLAEMAQTIDDAVIVSFGQLKAQGTLDEITARHHGRGHAGPHARGRPPVRACSPQAGIAFRRLGREEVAMDGVTPEQVGPLLASNQIVLYELTQEGGDLESRVPVADRRPRFRRRGGRRVINAIRAELLKMRSMPGRLGQLRAWPSR